MNEKLEKLNQEIEATEKKLRRAQHEGSGIATTGRSITPW